MVMEASYQMLDVLSFCDRETYRDRDNIANFSVKTIVQWGFPGCLFLENTRKTKLNLVKLSLSRE